MATPTNFKKIIYHKDHKAHEELHNSDQRRRKTLNEKRIKGFLIFLCELCVLCVSRKITSVHFILGQIHANFNLYTLE